MVQLYSHDGGSLRYNATTDRNQPWDPNREDRFDPNRDQFDPNRDQFDPNRNRFGGRFKRQFPSDVYNADPFRNRQDPNRRNQDQFGRDSYGTTERPYGRDPFNRDFFSNNDGFDDRNREFDPNKDNRNGTNTTFYEHFNIFESVPKYGINHNLLFSDVAKGLMSLTENQQTYSGYLGSSLDTILGVRKCPVNRMTLCVTSEMEHEKCIKMRVCILNLHFKKYILFIKWVLFTF